MTLIITVSIISFILGDIIGTVIGLFTTGVGKNNEEYEYYCKGFIDGYNKAKKEIK